VLLDSFSVLLVADILLILQKKNSTPQSALRIKTNDVLFKLDATRESLVVTVSVSWLSFRKVPNGMDGLTLRNANEILE
jgi:hypothetical protein